MCLYPYKICCLHKLILRASHVDELHNVVPMLLISLECFLYFFLISYFTHSLSGFCRRLNARFTYYVVTNMVYVFKVKCDVLLRYVNLILT